MALTAKAALITTVIHGFKIIETLYEMFTLVTQLAELTELS